MEISPCYGCTIRDAGCHAKCEKYGTWKSEREENRMQASEKRHSECMLDNYKICRIMKEKERKNDKKRVYGQ